MRRINYLSINNIENILFNYSKPKLFIVSFRFNVLIEFLNHLL